MSSINKIQLKLQQLPDRPGVYFFKDARDRVLYVGKATSLRDRVRSYFTGDLVKSRGHWLVKMLDQTAEVETVETDSALEALIEEAAYIKKHQPPYNSRDKDNKSFNYVVITDEKYPRVLVKRQRELKQAPIIAVRSLYGPFPSGGALKEALKIIRRLLPFRDRCRPPEELKDPRAAKPCFNYSLGLCPGVCTGVITERQYLTRIKNLEYLFRGQKQQLIGRLKKQMMGRAREQDFEQAAAIKRRIYGLEHIRDVSMLKRDFWAEPRKTEEYRIEGFDIAHLAGREMVGVMVVFEEAEPAKSQYRKFRLKTVGQSNDPAALAEIVTRRLKHPEWGWPDLLVIDGGETQRRAVLRAVRAAGYHIPVTAVVKDERHQPRDILGSLAVIENRQALIFRVNHETHRFAVNYHRRLARNRQLNR